MLWREKMIEKYLKECKLCPRNCRVNRLDEKYGRCKAREKCKNSTCFTTLL